MSSTPKDSRVVPAHVIQALFNNSSYLERYQQGTFRLVVVKDKHPSEPKADEPVCTRSQTVKCFEQNTLVAVVHRYLRQDGTLGASGLPDPKYLLHDGTVYRAKHE